MAMTSVCQKSICIYQDCRNKGFMFTVKEIWDRVCSPENQFFNISSCKWPSTSSLKSFTWFWRGIDELLPIYFSSHQHVQHMTSQILLILIDFLVTFYPKLLFRLVYFEQDWARLRSAKMTKTAPTKIKCWMFYCSWQGCHFPDYMKFPDFPLTFPDQD